MPFYYTAQRVFFFLYFLLLSLVGVAQCEYLGIVQSPSENCPLYIYDIETGQYFDLDSSTYELFPGQLVFYSYQNVEYTGDTCGIYPIFHITPTCLEQEIDFSGISADMICDATGCVHPGDADGNLKANIYDLLNIGLAYGTTGPERPQATEIWEAQFAPDWEQSTVQNVNYKHIDCNGDGVIDEEDVQPIHINYLPEQELILPPNEEAAPSLHIEFSADTIYFDNTTSQQVEVTATISVGDSTFPVEDLHGLAFMLEYPYDLVPPHSVNTTYISDSFFGTEEETLSAAHDLYPLGRNDIALTRKSGNSVDGEGAIFTTSFIIIIDIIAGRAENEIPFKVDIKNLEAIDGDGNPIIINGLAEDAGFLIIDNTAITNVLQLDLSEKIELSPNPSHDVLNINLKDIEAEQLEIFDTFGRKIFSQTKVSNTLSLDVSSYSRGLYFLSLQTEKGLVSKKFMIE